MNEDNESYEDGYEKGFNDGQNDGHVDGYREGFRDGIEEGEKVGAKATTMEMEEQMDRVTTSFRHKVETLNAQVQDLRMELFELRKEHAATTRIISKSTE